VSAAFTPGPWRLQPWKIGHRQRHRAIYAKIAPGHYPEGVLAHTMGSRPEAMNDANAALIAAAPDLYRVVEDLLSYPSVRAAIGDKFEERALTVLAQARGEHND
jgi:hypothetical protein